MDGPTSDSWPDAWELRTAQEALTNVAKHAHARRVAACVPASGALT